MMKIEKKHQKSKKRLYEENIKNKFNDIIKGKLNNDTGMLNDEEFEIYKRYRKIKNPNGYNTTKIPTYGAVKKYYERNS